MTQDTRVPSNPYRNPLRPDAIADSPATDHNFYIKGDLMYQSNDDSGLRVLDISDPENPRPIGLSIWCRTGKAPA